MPGSETIKLDPAAVATARTELNITDYVALDGVDYGDATIEQYLAERGGYGGAIPIDYRVPNRTVTMPLRLQQRGTVTFDQIRTKLQSKAALFQAEGGWLGRVTSSGGTVYADVTNASLKFGGGWGQARGRHDENAELTLECLPDWYGDEVSASSAHSETSLPELKWTETGIDGNYPGRVRLVVTEADGDDQLGLIWGFRSRHYSSASTAALAYEAEALTPMDAAAIASLSGASGAGSNTMQHANLGANWTPVLNTNLLAGTYLTHVGSYRVWARVYSTSGSTVNLRFVYDVGDMTNPTENEAWEFPAFSQFYLADLGEIRLDETTGTHRWQGQIHAKGAVGGESVRIDRLYFQPLDESAGRLTAPNIAFQGSVAHSARDEFNQSAGNLNAKTAAVGGAWATSGATTDFAVETTGKTAQRSATSDASYRYAISGVSAFAAQVVQVDVKFSALESAAVSPGGGAVARWIDANNRIYAAFVAKSTNAEFVVSKLAGGSGASLGSVAVTLAPSAWWTIRLLVDAAGRWYAWAFPQGSTPGDPLLSGQDSALATGGALASGKPGFFDIWPGVLASTRNYDNFVAWVPPSDAVVFANQSVELRTDGMFREDSAGNAYGPVSEVIGDLPRVPVAGIEGRTTEAFVLASRGDLDELPDAGIDDKNAQLYYRACWLQTPDDTGS